MKGFRMFLSRNIFRALTQGSQIVGIHTTACTPQPQFNLMGSNQSKIKCTLIPGDGVGPELVASVQEVFKAAEIPVEFESLFLSEMEPKQSVTLEEVVKSIAETKICMKGIIAHPIVSPTGDPETLNMKFRNELDLYANVLHVKSLPNVKSRHRDMDCIIIREQTEGEYSAKEHEAVPGVVECLKIVTAVKSQRIAKFAFDYAVKMGRKKVTAVHKANIMKLGDGLFLRSCEEIAKLYPRITFENMIVDNCTMQMVSDPKQFDVLVTPNLYGNIINNLASGLVGGAGVVAGACYSAECAVFEQGARQIFASAAGQNIANPTATLLGSANLLAHVNLHSYSNMIKNAINKVLKEGKVRTQDLGGKSTTKDFTNAVISSLEKK